VISFDLLGAAMKKQKQGAKNLSEIGTEDQDHYCASRGIGFVGGVLKRPQE